MRQLKVLFASVAMAVLAACGPVDEQPAAEGTESSAVAEALAEAELALADACQPDNYNACVAAGFGSCSAWSATADCGPLECDPEYGLSPCYTRVCAFGTCENVPDGATFTQVQKYRVCSNPLGQSCTEWMVTSRRVKCGC